MTTLTKIQEYSIKVVEGILDVDHIEWFVNGAPGVTDSRLGRGYPNLPRIAEIGAWTILGDFGEINEVEARGQLLKDSANNTWRYNGALPFTTTVNTLPTAPDWSEVAVNPTGHEIYQTLSESNYNLLGGFDNKDDLVINANSLMTNAFLNGYGGGLFKRVATSVYADTADATPGSRIDTPIGIFERVSVSETSQVRTSHYGVTGAGDETAKLEKAFQDAKDGVVLIFETSTTSSEPLYLPSTSGGITWINGSELTYTREQNSDGLAFQSAISYKGSNGAVFNLPKITYTGQFLYPFSYNGLVHGLYLIDCDNVTVFGSKIKGFNSTGIFLGWLDRDEDNPCKNNKIIDCDASENRVAGISYSMQDGLEVKGGYYAKNGHVSDNGTGYGISAGSRSTNTNIVIDGCTTYRNYRKGIDIHDGGSYTVVNCYLIEDRLFSFDASSEFSDFTSLIVMGNTAIVDPAFAIAAQKTFYAFEVQINSNEQPGQGVSDPVILVKNNAVINLGNNDIASAVRPFVFVYAGKSSCDITFAGNKVDGETVDECLFISCKPGSSGKVLVTKESNTFSLASANNLTKSLAIPAAVDLTIKSINNTYNIPTVNSFNHIYETANFISKGDTLNGNPLEEINRLGAGSIRKKEFFRKLVANNAIDIAVLARGESGGHYTIDFCAHREVATGGAMRSGKATFSLVTFNGSRTNSAVVQEDTLLTVGGNTLGITISIHGSGSSDYVVRVTADVACDFTAELNVVSGLDTSTAAL